MKLKKKRLLDLMKAKSHAVEGINFAQKPYEERYTNARAEMYAETAKAIKAGLYVDKQDIKTQLSYTTISVNNTGKFQLCKKEEIKEMIGHSPDEADPYRRPHPPRGRRGRADYRHHMAVRENPYRHEQHHHRAEQ